MIRCNYGLARSCGNSQSPIEALGCFSTSACKILKTNFSSMLKLIFLEGNKIFYDLKKINIPLKKNTLPKIFFCHTESLCLGKKCLLHCVTVFKKTVKNSKTENLIKLKKKIQHRRKIGLEYLLCSLLKTTFS